MRRITQRQMPEGGTPERVNHGARWKARSGYHRCPDFKLMHYPFDHAAWELADDCSGVLCSDRME
jgi:hypothetical protein